MGVSLDKVPEHLVSLVKETHAVSLKKGLDPSQNQAAVLVIIDTSLSTQQLYEGGTMQDVTDLVIAAAFAFDDDGDLPIAFFENKVHSPDHITLANCKNFLKNKRPRIGGGTSYTSALQWIVDEAGYGSIDLSTVSTQKTGGGFFHKGQTQTITSPLSVKAVAPYPTFAVFITDGKPNPGTEGEIVDALTAMSQLPIFTQFIGVGRDPFVFLHSLDDLQGRLIDNAGFFDSKNASNQQQMLEGLLNEFPQYYTEARSVGLIR